tara:strand:+ start:92 stop:337 length:246 start_codon:yes stop_codon:yes gene_type:complete
LKAGSSGRDTDDPLSWQIKQVVRDPGRSRWSSKYRAMRDQMFNREAASRSNNPPASEVISPLSNAARTLRRPGQDKVGIAI